MRKRLWFKIHLSTMIILALVLGGLLTINFLPLSRFSGCAPAVNGNSDSRATVRFWVASDIGWPIAIGRRSYYVDAVNDSTADEILSKPPVTNSEVDLRYAERNEFVAGVVFNGFVAIFFLGIVALICENVIRAARRRQIDGVLQSNGKRVKPAS